MTNIQSIQAQSQLFTFDLYDVCIADNLNVLTVSSLTPKTITVLEQNITIQNTALFERSILYLSPAQQTRLPQTLKENHGFMNYIKACRLMIPNNLLTVHQFNHQVSHTDALRLMILSAEQGFAPAQYNLGACLQFGIGIEKNNLSALDYYQKAAEQGLGIAQVRLASLYHHGYTTQKDQTKAFEWYEKAADQNIPIAQYNIGYYYAHGVGRAQDLEKARDWYQKAADQGFIQAQYGLRWVNSQIPKIPTPAQQKKVAHRQNTQASQSSQPPLTNPLDQILSDIKKMEERHQNEIQAMKEKYETSITNLRHQIQNLESRVADHQVILSTLENQSSLLPVRSEPSLKDISIEEFSEAPSPKTSPISKKRVGADNGNAPKRQQLLPKESAE